MNVYIPHCHEYEPLIQKESTSLPVSLLIMILVKWFISFAYKMSVAYDRRWGRYPESVLYQKTQKYWIYKDISNLEKKNKKDKSVKIKSVPRI